MRDTKELRAEVEQLLKSCVTKRDFEGGEIAFPDPTERVLALIERRERDLLNNFGTKVQELAGKYIKDNGATSSFCDALGEMKLAYLQALKEGNPQT